MFDVLVGINLLREGLDIPEVSLVAILDADKEGFLRSETSLIQTIGRAARNEHGMVVLYADSITPSMRRAMDETERRRTLQDAFNKAHGITPQSVKKKVQDVIEITSNVPTSSKKKLRTKGERQQEIARLTRQMKEAAKMLEFEIAAQLRDQIEAAGGRQMRIVSLMEDTACAPGVCLRARPELLYRDERRKAAVRHGSDRPVRVQRGAAGRRPGRGGYRLCSRTGITTTAEDWRRS